MFGLRFATCYAKTAKTAESVKKKNARRSHDAVIRVYDEAGNVIQTHEQAGDFKEW
jgi:hypothetical protein